MTVRKKIATTIFFVLAGLVLIIFVGGSTVLWHDARETDQEQTIAMVSRGLGVLSREIMDIQRVNKDWSAWDDTCAFVQDRNNAYAESNLVEGTFINNELTYFVITNRSGEYIADEHFNLKKKQKEPASASLRDLLNTTPCLTNHNSRRSSIAGIWYLENTPVILVSAPIVMSDFSGPIRGALIFGRELDKGKINELGDIAQIDISMFPLQSPAISQQVKKTLLNASENQSMTAEVVDENTILGFGLVKDGTGKPSAIIRVTKERTSYQAARRNFFFLTFFLVLIGTVAGFLALSMLDRLVLKRLAGLLDFFQKIDSEQELLKRHVDTGNDEFSRLTGAINSLLERLRKQFAEYREVDEALRKSENKYHVVSENIPVAVYSALLDSNTLSIIFISGKILGITGYAAEEFLSVPELWVKIVHPDDRKSVDQEIKLVQQSSMVLDELRYRIITKDQRVKWVRNKGRALFDLGGNLMRVDGFMEDITEQHNAEEALLESEERYRSVIKQSLEGIFIAELETRRLIEANPALCAMLGYDPEDISTLRIDDLSVLEHDDLDSKLKEVIARGGVNSEGVCRKKGGVTFQVEANLNVITLKGNKVFCGVIRDISERKRLEAQLFQSQKMEAIGTLAGGVAHDFNNLLMGILGRSSLMRMEIKQGHPFFEHLTEMDVIVKKAAGLTKQLLGFARGGKYEVAPTDLNELLEKSVDMFGRTKKEIVIHKSFEKDIWVVEVDRTQIEQVLLNLFVNAWQAMPDGGALYVATKNVIMDEKGERAFDFNPGKYVKISVTDTGIGMDQKILKRIFEPFFTTKELGKGTGLGLASSYGIIKNHGGMITVDSEQGKGSTFRIYLPSSEKEILKESELASEIVKGQGTVLLIDDEKMVLDIGKKILTSLGYTVLTAQNGREAIDIYRQQKDAVNLIILDIIMPEMGAQEVFDKIHNINPRVKILLSSGYSLEGQAARLLEQGCSGFIQKPFGAKELSRKIMEIFLMK